MTKKQKETLSNKDIIEYFRSNLFESIAAYNAWKMISYSRSTKVVSKEMADRYVEVQKYHGSFFIHAERAFLVHFIMFMLHSFDKRNDAQSLYLVNQKSTDNFVNKNKKIIQELRKVRNKIFAHKDIKQQAPKLPSVIRLDEFFKNLIKFYNKLSHDTERSTTMFDNAEDIKREIEFLFMNLERGEIMRKKEIDIQWLWEKDDKKASDVL